MLQACWTPSPAPLGGACSRLSRPRTTTGPPPHSGSISWQRAFPPDRQKRIGTGAIGVVPTFTLKPLDRVGTQLCSCNIVTATPQTFTVTSRSTGLTDQRVFRALKHGYALPPSPYLSGWSWCVNLGALYRWFLTYAFLSCLPDPDHLTVLVRPVVVRAAFSLPLVPGIGLPSVSFGPLRRASGSGLAPLHG